jgi:hypothetical protein
VGDTGDPSIRPSPNSLSPLRHDRRGSHSLEPGQMPVVAGADLAGFVVVQMASVGPGGQALRDSLEQPCITASATSPNLNLCTNSYEEP